MGERVSQAATLAILVAALAGCGGKVRPDPYPAATLSGDPTAEFWACGRMFVGSGACPLEPESDLSELNLRIPVYLKGSVTVASERCAIEPVFLRYDGSQILEIPLSGRVQNCGIWISVNPEFPGEPDLPISFWGMRGFLFIKRLTDAPWQWRLDKAKVGSDLTWYVDVEDIERVSVRGCGVDTSHSPRRVVGTVSEFRLSDYVGIDHVEDCVLAINLLGARSRQLTWITFLFAEDYVPMPRPVLRENGDELTVIADPSAAVISVGGRYHLGHEGSFRLAPGLRQTVRVASVKGRFHLCIRDPGEPWRCKR